jgi:hypothetical protein
MKYLKDPTNAMLDKEIRDLKGISKNLNERVQTVAVGIIEHDINHGDCSRAPKLINALPTGEQRRFLIQFLAYFGAIGVKMEKGTATGVGHIASDSNRYRKPDLEGARANMWFEPFDAAGNKADWYQGPNPRLFVPGTLGDLGVNIVQFADRTEKRLTDTRDNGAGVQVPNFELEQDELIQVRQALAVIRKVGNAVAAREQLANAQAEAERLQAEVANADNVFALGAEAATEEQEAQSDETPAAASA